MPLRNWVLLCAALPAYAALPGHPRLLLNEEGIASLRARIQTAPWSEQWKGFQSAYNTAALQKIELPPRGSNWFHWYVCPRHGIRLTTGKSVGPWRWEHICPVDQEVFLGDPSQPQRDFDGCALSGPHDRYARAVRDGGLLYRVTGERRYAERARDILLAYAGRYLDYPLHTTTGEPKIGGGRVGPQTLDEAVWLIPMAQGADLIWDILTDAERRTLADKLFLPAARDVILPHRMGVHNIQCWKNSAVGLTGFLLGDDALIHAAIDDPDRGYRTQMAKGVQGDGVWFEGAWSYHFYTLSALWPLTEAARNSGIDLYGEPLRKMFAAPVQLAMPNRMLPAFNDSGETPVRNPLYELAYARYRDPLFLSALAGASRRNEYALWFGADTLPAEPARTSLSYNAAESGYAILTRGGTWLCLKYGPHGGGHGHPDKNNFVLYARGQVLFPDPGTRPYGAALHAEWDRATLGHNTLVVDGASQAPATGRLLAFGGNFAMTEAGPIYPGVRFVRTAVLVSENAVVFVDRVTSDRSHTFDLAVHFQGGPTLPRGGPVTTLPTTNGYQHLRDATMLQADRIGPVVLAKNEATQVIAATGPGKSTDERIPVVLFRRTGREATFIWGISIDGAPLALDADFDDGIATVQLAGGPTVVVDTDARSVFVR